MPQNNTLGLGLRGLLQSHNLCDHFSIRGTECNIFTYLYVHTYLYRNSGLKTCVLRYLQRHTYTCIRKKTSIYIGKLIFDDICISSCGWMVVRTPINSKLPSKFHAKPISDSKFSTFCFVPSKFLQSPLKVHSKFPHSCSEFIHSSPYVQSQSPQSSLAVPSKPTQSSPAVLSKFIQSSPKIHAKFARSSLKVHCFSI